MSTTGLLVLKTVTILVGVVAAIVAVLCFSSGNRLLGAINTVEVVVCGVLAYIQHFWLK